VNGSEGISTGFAQKILPREPKKVISELKKVLKGTKKIENIDLGKPYWEGFTGEVVQDDEKPSKWHIYGDIDVQNKNNIIVNELPIGYDLKKYIAILTKLQDQGVISSFKDYSEDSRFRFKIKVKREFSDKYDGKEIHNELKLRSPITENYTTIDEENRIRVFDNMEDIFRAYFKVRMDFFKKRKEYIISRMNRDIDVLSSKYLFIQSVINGDVEVNNKAKKNIVSQIDKIEKIIEIEGNYDYLLRMPIYSLTKEKLDEIKNKIKDLKDELKDYKKMSLEDLWLNDIEEFKIK
jgi:DNA topoisomerase-2